MSIHTHRNIAYHAYFSTGREGRNGNQEQALPVEHDDGIPSEPAPPYEQGAKAAPEVVPEAATPSLIEDELDEQLQRLVTSASGVGSARGEVCTFYDLDSGSGLIVLSITGHVGTAYVFETAPGEEAKVRSHA